MKVALAVHRVDFWRIRDEFSPYEWALLKAMACVYPWGDDRADLGRAVVTSRIVASNGVSVSEVDFRDMQYYLKCNAPQPKYMTPLELKAAMEGMHHGE